MNYMDAAAGRRASDILRDDGAAPPRGASPMHDTSLVSLGEILQVLRRGRSVLAACLLVSLAAAVVYLERTPPEYTATAQVILEPRRLTAQEAVAGPSATLDSAQAESQMQVAKSERILAAVFDALDLANAPEFAHPAPTLKQRLVETIGRFAARLLPNAPGDGAADPDGPRERAFQAFTDRVSVRRIGQSYVLEVSYRASRPEQASRLANSITAAYIHSQVERKLAAARRGAEFLENRVSVLQSEEEAAAQAIRDGVIPATSFPDAESRVISAAREPLGKSAPQTLLVLLFATAVGVLLGGGILAVRHSLDRRIRTAGQVWRHFGLPCLAVMPVARRRGTRRLPFNLAIDDPQGAFARALRVAYTAVVTGTARDAATRSLGVVSWRSGEGKSTFAGNLAHFIAATGEAVVLVDTDLADPTLSQDLAPGATGGLGEALSDATALTSLAPLQVRQHLGLVPAGGRYGPSRPNLFLGTAAMGRFLAHLRDGHDVVVDLPAMAHAPHAQAIAGFLDGVILVVESGRTTVDEVTTAIRKLDDAHGRILGIVLNKGDSRSAH
jgi:polysaccharide biosynthesis transport protein